MEKRVMMLIIGLCVIFGLPAALCEEETAATIEAAPADTGPPFVETETYETDMTDLEAEIAAADALLQDAIDAEESERIAADAALQADIDATEVVLQEQIDAVIASAPMPITQANIPLIISTPGSYYLTEDVTASGTAITVDVNDVTIDLAGFALVGPGSGTNYGIYMSGRSNVEIRNGTVRDFYYGIREDSSTILSQGHRIIDVRAVSNLVGGICLYGSGHLIKGCTAIKNGGSAGSNNAYGIFAYHGCTITGNTASRNGNEADSYAYGISAGEGSTVTGNTSSYNGYNCATGSKVYGIWANSGSTVTGNTASKNGIYASDVYGIWAGSGSTVTGNTSNRNGNTADGSVYGIYLGIRCLVDQNTAYGNVGTNMDMGVSGCVYGINVAP
jgi:hypothetical protein